MPTPRVLASFDTLRCATKDSAGYAMEDSLRQAGAPLGKETTVDTNQAANLIELAMNRSALPASNSAAFAMAQEADARSNWQREQESALKLRLNQLQNAQQGEKTKVIDPPAPRIVCPPSLNVSYRENKRAYSSTGLGALALVSILVAIGLIWFLIGAKHSPDTLEPQQFGQEHPVMPNPVLAQGGLAPVPTATPATLVADVMAPDESARVRDLVEHWVQAWMARDASAYLGFYSPNFVPARGQSHAHWEAARRKALSRTVDIDIKVSAMQLERLSDGQIKVDFLQDYTAGKYSEVAQPKSLILVRSGARWLIDREWQGAPEVPASGAN